MPADMKITAFVLAHLEPETLGALTDMVNQLLEWGVPRDTVIADGFIDLDIVERGDPEPLECGDHIPGDGPPVYDWLVPTHEHPALREVQP